MPPTDAQLVASVQRGDTAALGQLLERAQHRLYNVCLRMVSNRDDAAELTQETMLKVIEHIGDFHGHSDIGTWMTRIAMNLSISHLRKRKLRRTTSLDAGWSASASAPGSAPGSGGDGYNGSGVGGGCGGSGGDQSTNLKRQIADSREPMPEQRVQQREETAQVLAALDQLDEDFRAVLVLRDIQEMDYQEIADVLGLPVGTVKSRLFRARLALRHQVLAATAKPVRTREPAPEKADG